MLQKIGEPDLLVDIIKSFQTNMEARFRVDGQLSETIEVCNGLRQGCTMAPTLFNLYASMMAEKWTEAVQDVEGMGRNLLLPCKNKRVILTRGCRLFVCLTK